MKVKISQIRKNYVYIVLLLIFLSSDSIYGIYYDTLTPLKLLVGVIGILPIIFVFQKIRIKHLFYLFVFSVAFIVNSLNNGTSFDIWIMILFRIISLYPLMLLINQEKESFLEMYSDFMYKTAILFLVLFIVIVLIGDIIPYEVVNPSKNLFSYRNYYGVIFQLPRQAGLFDSYMFRSHGFTWEPGQYQIYLNFALYYYLFFKVENKKKIIILIISIFATMSTMGLLILSLQILGKILFMKKGRYFVVLKLMLGFIVIVLGMVILQEKSMSGSYELRTLDMANSIKAIKDNFVYGSGVRSFETSNGLLSVIADNGLFIISLLTLSAYKWVVATKSNIGIIESLLFICIFLLGLMNEPIQYTSFVFLLVWIMLFDKPKSEKLYGRYKL